MSGNNGRGGMVHVMLFVYRARRGEEDALIALHEDWERTLRPRVQGYLSGELLHDASDPQRFVAVSRFESQEAAQAASADQEQLAWQRRVESLTEGRSIGATYRCAWQTDRRHGERKERKR